MPVNRPHIFPLTLVLANRGAPPLIIPNIIGLPDMGPRSAAEAWPVGYGNVALAANGGVATASSGSGMSAAIDGDRLGAGGIWWADGTSAAFPDWLQVDFPTACTIDEIDVITAQDNYPSPVNPTEATTFTLYGITDFQVQYWTGSAWANVPGGSVTGNNKVWTRFGFPAITTTSVRVLVSAVPAGYDHSLIVELECWGMAGAAITEKAAITAAPSTASERWPPHSNVALSTAGTTASASSTLNSNYSPDNLINGDRKAVSWGSPGGGWADVDTTFPDWVRLDFAGARTIDEVSVFCLQDDPAHAVDPTEGLLFTLFGVTDLYVEYWDGAGWTAIPGASVSGDYHVWKRFQFSPILTTAIRVNTTASVDGRSYLVEVEAMGSDPAANEQVSVAFAVLAGETAPSTEATALAIASALNEAAPSTAAQTLGIASSLNEAAPATESVAVVVQVPAVNEAAPTTEALTLLAASTSAEAAPTTSAVGVVIATSANEAGPTTSTTPVLISTTSAETGPSTEALALTVAPGTINEAAPTTQAVAVALLLTTINEAGPTASATALTIQTTSAESGAGALALVVAIDSVVAETGPATESVDLFASIIAIEAFTGSENASITATSAISVSAAESGLPLEGFAITIIPPVAKLAQTAFTSSESVSIRLVVLIYPQDDLTSAVIPATVSTTPVVVTAPTTTPIGVSASSSVAITPQADESTIIVPR